MQEKLSINLPVIVILIFVISRPIVKIKMASQSLLGSQELIASQ